MKTIAIKTTKIVENQRPLTTADLLKVCVETPPAHGFDVVTMRARLRIIDVIEKLPAEAKEIALEDADYAQASAAVREKRWGGFHRDLVEFAEAFGA